MQSCRKNIDVFSCFWKLTNLRVSEIARATEKRKSGLNNHLFTSSFDRLNKSYLWKSIAREQDVSRTVRRTLQR